MAFIRPDLSQGTLSSWFLYLLAATVDSRFYLITFHAVTLST